MKKRLLVLFFFIFVIHLPVMANPFSDLPKDHWAYDAVNMLQEKGLVEGYPDGLFKGDRPITRYEMAMVVARVVAKLEEIEASMPGKPDLSIYTTKDELETINRLLAEFRDELSALGVRVTNIEDSLGQITERIDNLEKVFVAGDMTIVGNATGIFPEDPNNTIVTEGFGGYSLTDGASVSSRLNLDIGVHINDDITAGGTLVAYSSFGTPAVTYSWGVIPPYNANGYSQDKIYNNGINFQADLNKLWFNTKGDWEINGTMGEYFPQKLSPLIFYGIVNSAYWAQDRLPVYGINLNGNIYNNYKFEFLSANDLTWADYGPLPVYSLFNPFDLFTSDFYRNPEGYHNRMYGTLGGYQNEKLDFDVTYLRIYEDRASRPESLLAPKDEIILGFRGSYKIFDDKLKFFTEFNRSWFGYDLRNSTAPRIGGDALIIGEEGTFSNFNYQTQFLRIDGNYEPLNFRKIYEFKYTEELVIGEGVIIPSIYRPNRTGFNSRVSYKLDEGKGALFASITYLKQIDPTLDTNPETTIGSPTGFQDHSFLNNSTDKGREFYYDLGAAYNLTDKWYIEGHYFSFNFKRSYADYEHDQTRHYLHLAGSYKITENSTVTGLYDLAKTGGIDDNGNNTDEIFHIPGVSFSYNFNENTAVGVDYRYYKHNDNLDSNNDYTAHRLSTWMQLFF